MNAAVAQKAEDARIFCARADDRAASSAWAPAVGRLGDLVGGGPGDPGLITVRGRQALARADVVVADHLARLSLLANLPPEVGVIDAAKLPRGRSMAQEQINTLLIEHARAGRRVVRLQRGDPFVFGWGMERSRPASPPASRWRWCPG